MKPIHEIDHPLLKGQLESKSTSHAYIFDAESEECAFSHALCFLQALHCKSDHRPCGECATCQKIMSLQTNDIYVIEPVNQTIPIEKIRQINEYKTRTPLELEQKTVIIRFSEKMRPEAANALLKNLEEPSDYLKFILCTEESAKLLTTIRSRCQIVYFTADKKSGYQLDQKKVIEITNAALLNDASLLFREKEFLMKAKEESGELFQIIRNYCSDALILSKTGDLTMVQDRYHIPFLDQIRGVSATRLIDSLYKVDEIEYNLKRNVNYQLSIEILFISMMEDK